MVQKIVFRLPQNDALQCAAGRVAMAHASLEYLLRLTIKSITREPFRVSLASTRRHMSIRLRKRILKLAKEKGFDSESTDKLADLVSDVGNLSDERNHILHRLWAELRDGNICVSNDNDELRPLDVPAEIAKLNNLADRIWMMFTTINQARRKGWLHDAIERAKQT